MKIKLINAVWIFTTILAVMLGISLKDAVDNTREFKSTEKVSVIATDYDVSSKTERVEDSDGNYHNETTYYLTQKWLYNNKEYSRNLTTGVKHYNGEQHSIYIDVENPYNIVRDDSNAIILLSIFLSFDVLFAIVFTMVYKRINR